MEISPQASLTQQLGLDSFRMATLFDLIRREHRGINLLPWLMNASQQGSDSVESLVAYVVTSSN